MESLTKHWSTLSFNDCEGGKVHLNKEKSSSDFVIAVKFLTMCASNTKVIVKTFSSIWKSVNGFKVRNVRDHIIFFIFDNEQEAEKILDGKPWSFNKHLVMLQRYDKSTLWAQRALMGAPLGEYASAEWTKAEKMSHHLVLWSRNHEYSALMWKD